MRHPKVSVGLPVYNGEKFLREAILSLLEQDYTDFELIISDNASTDGTEKICQEFAGKDPRIRYYRNTINMGAGLNFRRVFELAEGEFFKWATYDDLHYRSCLRRLTEVLESAPPRVILTVPRTEIVDEEGRPVKGRDTERLHTTRPKPYQRLAEILPRIDLATSQFGLYRKSALAKTRLIDNFRASDRVLLAEIAMLGEIWEVDEILFARRYHREVSTANRSKKELILFFDPKATKKDFKRRVLFEHFISIKRLPLTIPERVLCSGIILWIWSRKKGATLKKKFKERLASANRFYRHRLYRLRCLCQK
jgi:glycosyltransferase involved in cell wall biosynthesis